MNDLKNLLTDSGTGREKIMFVCTRIDTVLRGDGFEEPPVTNPEELPSDSESDSEEVSSDLAEGRGATATASAAHAISSQGDCPGTLEYSTRVHETVFDQLVSKSMLPKSETFDKCELFHCVSADEANQHSLGQKKSPFVDDFVRFERCLAQLIVGNLNVHLTNALQQLIRKQTVMIEAMFDTKSSNMQKVIVMKRRLQYVTTKEEELHRDMKRTLENGIDKLRQAIREVREECKETLPERAGYIDVVFSESEAKASRKEKDDIAAKQIRQFVSTRFNAKFIEKTMPALSFHKLVEKSVKIMEEEVKISIGEGEPDLKAVRMVESAYRPLFDIANAKRGLPFKLQFRRFVDSLTGKDKEGVNPYDPEWKETVAYSFLKSIKSEPLAKQYCSILDSNMTEAKTKFRQSLAELESGQESIVRETENETLHIQFTDGYELAKLFLNASSLRDCIAYGEPRKSGLLGKGPNTDVYACAGRWGGRKVVIKARKPWPPPESTQVWPASLYFSTYVKSFDNCRQKGFSITMSLLTEIAWIIVMSKRQLASSFRLVKPPEKSGSCKMHVFAA